MTKTQVIRQMAEQMDVSPKQIGAFFDLLIETATKAFLHELRRALRR